MSNCGDNASFTPAPSGGGGIGTLLKTQSLGHIQPSGTSAESTGQVIALDNYKNYDLLVLHISADSRKPNSHLCSLVMVLLYNNSFTDDYGNVKDDLLAVGHKLNYMTDDSNGVAAKAISSYYGIYPNSVYVTNDILYMPISVRYNATSTSEIDNDYTARVYGINLYDLIP